MLPWLFVMFWPFLDQMMERKKKKEHLLLLDLSAYYYYCYNFSEMVLAGAFARWYWTFDKGDVPCCILGVSFSNAVFYHLGTVALGSFIIAVIRMIRTIVSYVESKLKMYNNDLTRCLICLCKCCLWCLEKFMRFINRNAYIMCAIKSTNFCTSAKDAFSLLMRNILRYNYCHHHHSS